jgi:hypothetical protein
VIACAGLHVAERAMHGRLPRWQNRVTQSLWGPAFEGAALGVVLMAAVVVSGAGAEFIYFQF